MEHAKFQCFEKRHNIHFKSILTFAEYIPQIDDGNRYKINFFSIIKQSSEHYLPLNNKGTNKTASRTSF